VVNAKPEVIGTHCQFLIGQLYGPDTCSDPILAGTPALGHFLSSGVQSSPVRLSCVLRRMLRCSGPCVLFSMLASEEDHRERNWSSFAIANAVLEETPLHRIARQLERDDKMFARVLKMAAANLKFAERGVVEGIVGKAL
jgi:hypothetical protein